MKRPSWVFDIIFLKFKLCSRMCSITTQQFNFLVSVAARDSSSNQYPIWKIFYTYLYMHVHVCCMQLFMYTIVSLFACCYPQDFYVILCLVVYLPVDTSNTVDENLINRHTPMSILIVDIDCRSRTYARIPDKNIHVVSKIILFYQGRIQRSVMGG